MAFTQWTHWSHRVTGLAPLSSHLMTRAPLAVGGTGTSSSRLSKLQLSRLNVLCGIPQLGRGRDLNPGLLVLTANPWSLFLGCSKTNTRKKEAKGRDEKTFFTHGSVRWGTKESHSAYLFLVQKKNGIFSTIGLNIKTSFVKSHHCL